MLIPLAIVSNKITALGKHYNADCLKKNILLTHWIPYTNICLVKLGYLSFVVLFSTMQHTSVSPGVGVPDVGCRACVEPA